MYNKYNCMNKKKVTLIIPLIILTVAISLTYIPTFYSLFQKNP